MDRVQGGWVDQRVLRNPTDVQIVLSYMIFLRMSETRFFS